MWRPESRTPKDGVHSAPEYVVGTETSGSDEAAEAAFAVSIALPPPTARMPSARRGTSIRSEGISSQRHSAGMPSSFQRGLETRSGRSMPTSARSVGQLFEAPADDHPSRSPANFTNASAARVAARPVARTSEISRTGSSPSTRASAIVPAARSDSIADREMKVTP